VFGSLRDFINLRQLGLPLYFFANEHWLPLYVEFYEENCEDVELTLKQAFTPALEELLLEMPYSRLYPGCVRNLRSSYRSQYDGAASCNWIRIILQQSHALYPSLRRVVTWQPGEEGAASVGHEDDPEGFEILRTFRDQGIGLSHAQITVPHVRQWLR
jgi:hypothetical protein